MSSTRRLPRLEDFPEAGPNALATFQQRGFARVADELIVLFPVALVIMVLNSMAIIDGDAAASGEAQPIPVAVLGGILAVQVIYEIVAVAVWGQTIGKLITGIRVARYTDGKRPTWAQSALRCLVWAAGGAAGVALLGLAAVGALPVFLSAWRGPLRRAWHDEAGGTIVVRTR